MSLRERGGDGLSISVVLSPAGVPGCVQRKKAASTIKKIMRRILGRA